MGGMFLCTKTRLKRWDFDHRRRQHQCPQKQTDISEETCQGYFSIMSCNWREISPVISIIVLYLLVSSSVSPAYSLETVYQQHATSTDNQTLRPQQELHKLKIIRAHLNKLNKPALKTIQAFSLFSSSSSSYIYKKLIDFHSSVSAAESGW